MTRMQNSQHRAASLLAPLQLALAAITVMAVTFPLRVVDSRLRGTVTDPQGQPFLGATVAIDGNIETKTAEDGAHIWTCWKPEHTS